MKKKRGRTGLFAVFEKGRKGYVKIFPGRQHLIFSRDADAAVRRGITDAFDLFAGIHVQNNISETVNNVLQSMVELKGNRDKDKLAKRIRTFFVFWNQDPLLPSGTFKRGHGAAPLMCRLFNVDYNVFLTKMSMNLYENKP